ncbi:MAG: COX15/CtaA family protein [Thermoplasmata archaeon]
MDGHRWFRYWTYVALAMCWITIILGGNVIASGSGLGCPDWPLCQPGDGLFPTLSGPTGIEWTHRLAAFFLAVTIVVLTVLAVAYERHRPAMVRLSLGALVLVGVLALLGGAVVDSDLNIGLVLVHFGVATILLAILLVLAMLANWGHIPRRWKRWAERAASEHPAPPCEPPAESLPSNRALAPDGSLAGEG